MFLSRCSFDSVTTSMMNKSHIMACFVFCFVIPFLMIFTFYFYIVQAVCKHETELHEQGKKMNVTSLRSNADQDVVSAEIKAAKVAFDQRDPVDHCLNPIRLRLSVGRHVPDDFTHQRTSLRPGQNILRLKSNHLFSFSPEIT